MNAPKPIEVKMIRAEKRGRKIILVIQPDLFSDEPFASSPFYKGTDRDNVLQEIGLHLSVREKAGCIIDAKVWYDGTHYTQGHSQIHGLNRHFLNDKDCAIDWALNSSEQYYSGDRIKLVLDRWKDDVDFSVQLTGCIHRRLQEMSRKKLQAAIQEHRESLLKLEELLKPEVEQPKPEQPDSLDLPF